jgi:hypothetical protein
VLQLHGGGNMFFQLPGAVLTLGAMSLEGTIWMKLPFKERLK